MEGWIEPAVVKLFVINFRKFHRYDFWTTEPNVIDVALLATDAPNLYLERQVDAANRLKV